MISLDDTGLPPTPSGGGWMLLVPEAAVPDLWAGVGMEEPEALEYTAFPTTPDLLADVDGDVVPVDDDGHFQLTRTGPHLICHLPEPAGSGEAPAGARGCDVVDLPVSGALKVTYGEGGFHAYLV